MEEEKRKERDRRRDKENGNHRDREDDGWAKSCQVTNLFPYTCLT